MTFTQIQTGNNITRWYLDGLRVTKDRFNSFEINAKSFCCFRTTEIRPNVFKHTKESII